MINEFKDNEIRKSGIIYNSLFTQIKKLYDKGKYELAGELAISAIELALTGDFSSDNDTVEIALETFRVINHNDKDKWDAK